MLVFQADTTVESKIIWHVLGVRAKWVFSCHSNKVKSCRAQNWPEQHEEGEEEVPEVVASMDDPVFARLQAGLVETDFAKQLHPDDGEDEEEHRYQQGDVGQSLE